MEPVPETERMDFTASPVPTLRIQSSSLYEYHNNERDSRVKPPTIRRSTDPTPHSPSPLSPASSSPSLPYRPRNTSPYSRGHLRSKSSHSALAPPMSRAQSLPGFNGAGQLLIAPQRRPASPVGSPSRIRTPRKSVDESLPGLPNRNLEDIREVGSPTSEEPTPKATERSSSPILGLPQNSSFSRNRRPSSPLRHLAQQNASVIASSPSTPSSVTSSPSYQSSRYDSFLGATYSNSLSYSGSFTSSSVPSTPTSARSRSPSISSLETIPDSPDAEEAALEAERIAQLKVAADAADGDEESKAKAALEAASTRGRTLGTTFGRDKRKRWSVCGAERRGDLNLDTIWED